MANAYLSLGRTLTLQQIVGRACAAARIPTNSTGPQFLATSASSGNQELVDLARDVERDMLRRFPLFNISQDSALAATAGVRYSNIPTSGTLRADDIIRLCWLDVSTGYEYRDLIVCSENELNLLPKEIKNPLWTEMYPRYAVFPKFQTGGQACVEWYGMPQTNLLARLIYRVAPAEWSIYDLNQSTATAGTITFSGGHIATIPVSDGGYGYTTATVDVTITGNGTGAEAQGIVTNGVVTSIDVVSEGTGYTTATATLAAPSATISQLPDYLLDCYADNLGWRLGERNLGGAGIDWQSLKAKNDDAIKVQQYSLAQSPFARSQQTFGPAGRPIAYAEQPLEVFNFDAIGSTY